VELFDVADAFNRALVQSRLERGEPASGLKRRLWEAGELAKNGTRSAINAAVIASGIFAGTAGLALLLTFLTQNRNLGISLNNKTKLRRNPQP